MKKFFITCTAFVCLLSLTSCANYKAISLASLAPSLLQEPINLSDVSVGCKMLDVHESKVYLGRDVLHAGYQPLQINIQNHSAQTYLFSVDRVSLPCVKAEEVASKVHTSTATRAGVYGTLGVLTSGLFLIPAVVDGMKSHEANKQLDQDYQRKSKNSVVLYPHEQLNSILFVPLGTPCDQFSVTLLNQQTAEPTTVEIRTSL